MHHQLIVSRRRRAEPHPGALRGPQDVVVGVGVGEAHDEVHSLVKLQTNRKRSLSHKRSHCWLICYVSDKVTAMRGSDPDRSRAYRGAVAQRQRCDQRFAFFRRQSRDAQNQAGEQEVTAEPQIHGGAAGDGRRRAGPPSRSAFIQAALVLEFSSIDTQEGFILG